MGTCWCFLCDQVEGSEPYWQPAIVFCVTRSKGLNRIGNLLVPNDNYCKFEDWLIPILDTMLEEQTSQVTVVTGNHSHR